ncbi:LysR family transcriptional regulator [Bdellovibrio svalbardensis]|uniref:LysR family transcriptional regulator n=1 Tax=Bdellovibrio svalbardensis TaxID=2972972 RepID=A0ABT6DHQ1_9BACT|nr:LysR family transcriptional regulator [Bdellovibrio svalbardensis]MDG0815449.1 LysR family transcriptional regulator [Bdellovibrio svalbardensis]
MLSVMKLHSSIQTDIPLYLWESFIAVIEEGTLQRAAEKIKTTQPTITRHLAQLEDGLPLALFELRGRKKEPTVFALDLYEKIKKRLGDLPVDIRHSVQNFASAKNVAISVAGHIEVLRRVLTAVTFDGRLNLFEASSAELKRHLKEGNYDVILTRDLHDTELYVCKKLFEDEPTLVVPKSFLKGSKDLQSWWLEKRTEYPMSLYSEELDFFQELQGQVKVDFRVRDWLTLEERVHAGKSWSVIPSSYVRPQASYLHQSHRIRNKSVRTEFYIYYRRDLSRLTWFKEFLEEILNKAKKL